MVYAVTVSSGAAATSMQKTLMIRNKRIALLAMTGAYQTTSSVALPTFAGVQPLVLEVERFWFVARKRWEGLGKFDEAKRLKYVVQK